MRVEKFMHGINVTDMTKTLLLQFPRRAEAREGTVFLARRRKPALGVNRSSHPMITHSYFLGGKDTIARKYPVTSLY
jgi:hypothetical protein